MILLSACIFWSGTINTLPWWKKKCYQLTSLISCKDLTYDLSDSRISVTIFFRVARTRSVSKARTVDALPLSLGLIELITLLPRRADTSCWRATSTSQHGIENSYPAARTLPILHTDLRANHSLVHMILLRINKRITRYAYRCKYTAPLNGRHHKWYWAWEEKQLCSFWRSWQSI